MQSLLFGTLVFVIEVPLVYLRQHCVDKVDCNIYFFVHEALYVCGAASAIRPGPLQRAGAFIPGGKGKHEARQAVFLTPTNHFGDDFEEEKSDDDSTIPQKASYVTRWRHNQDALYWVRLQRAQDQRSEFWQMKSFPIMTDTKNTRRLH